jgi:anti-sigma regulatory factor (Ser/Thr protein kinase)
MDPLQLPFDHGIDSASLRHAVLHHLVDWQTPDLVNDTLLVITELVENVIEHTDDGGELALHRYQQTVLVEVYDHSHRMPHLYRPDPRRIGGRGILLVDAISQTWGTRPTASGKVVWASLLRQPAARNDR